MSGHAIYRGIATFFGIGLLRPAPGTWGSLAALPAAWLIAQWAGFFGLVFCTIIVFFAGIGAIHQVAGEGPDVDRSEFVIDEVAGQWIALMPVVYGANMMQVDVLRLWPGWIAAFVLFRLFDIWKPGPIGTADKRKDPLGVMLDDVLAGIAAAIGVILVGWLWHAVMM